MEDILNIEFNDGVTTYDSSYLSDDKFRKAYNRCLFNNPNIKLLSNEINAQNGKLIISTINDFANLECAVIGIDKELYWRIFDK